MERNNSETPDPMAIFRKWYQEAQMVKGGLSSNNRLISAGLSVVKKLFAAFLPWSNLLRPDIATLATIAPENRPAARSVLFKGLVHNGFSFYTDYESDKGKELSDNPSAVLVFYWHLPPRQVRIDGKVLKLPREEAEADWKARRRENQLASAAARQSSMIGGREELLEKVQRIKHRYKGKPVPCPGSWGGYRLVPEKIEFWQGRLDWIHERERYVLKNGAWERMYLVP